MTRKKVNGRQRMKADGRQRWSKQRRTGKRKSDGDNLDPAKRALISQIQTMGLEDMPSLIEVFAKEDMVPFQYEVVEACLSRILREMSPGSDHSPHPEQIRTVRRLIYGKGDTLLIARTGFGKSLILYSFSILTGKITLQVIPLNKLADQQLKDISQLGAHPCVLNADSKRRQHDLISQIKAGKYSHVLLGPEQAVSKPFRDALKETELQCKIGLVAIDECHLVKQWESFRAEFTMLGQLRMLLRPDVLWFGCSATLGEEAERFVLEHAGFRRLGSHQWQTELIRTSIDRNDVSICIRPVPRGKLTSYEALYFLLDAATTEDEAVPGRMATPERIAKTIVFIDSIAKVNVAATYLRAMLLLKTESAVPTPRYTDEQNSPYSVHTIIQTFTARVSSYDQDVRYQEFSKSSSKIRIMVATTSLGMGINIPDIERTVVWKLPIGADPCDVWQRIGRGGRGKGRTSQGYILLPYWLFDSEGIDRATDNARIVPRKRANRARGSQLIELSTPDGLSDIESVGSALSEPEIAGVRHWTKTELASRSQISDIWKEIANGSCCRRPFLSYLGENKLPGFVQTPSERCCNRCNPTLNPPFTLPAETPKLAVQPRNGTRESCALVMITQWAGLQAESIYSHVDRRYPMPSTAFMDMKCQWQLAYLYKSGRSKSAIDLFVLDEIEAKAPLIREWRYREEYRDRLIQQLNAIVGDVDQAYAMICQQKRDRRDQRSQNAREQQPSEDVFNAERHAEAVRRRDDTLAIQVARRVAAKALESNGNAEARAPTPTPTPTPLTPQRPVYSPLTSPLTGGSEEHTGVATTPTATMPNRKRRDHQELETPSKRRPLTERNVNKILLFSPVSRSGRVRTATLKGKENFKEG